MDVETSAEKARKVLLTLPLWPGRNAHHVFSSAALQDTWVRTWPVLEEPQGKRSTSPFWAAKSMAFNSLSPKERGMFPSRLTPPRGDARRCEAGKKKEERKKELSVRNGRACQSYRLPDNARRRGETARLKDSRQTCVVYGHCGTFATRTPWVFAIGDPRSWIMHVYLSRELFALYGCILDVLVMMGVDLHL